MKKDKLKPLVLHTREAMEAALSDYARLKLDYVALAAQMESEKTEIEKRYQANLGELARAIEVRFAGIQNFCVLHRSTLLPADRKSFDTTSATVRFYDTPPRVEKRGKETLGSIARRLFGLVFELRDPASGNIVETLDCSKYVREPDPELNKEALLADRKRLGDHHLAAMGVRFESDEIFAIEPKSQLADPQSERLAA